MTNSAQSLLQYFESGDAKYFHQFYHEIYPLAFQTAFYITNNNADAEDTCQQAFIIVYRQLETCMAIKEKNESTIKSWFLSIVYNQAKLQVRSKVRQKKRESTRQKRKDETPNNNDNKERLQEVKAAIETLPEKYRTPILLKYRNGLENAEISQVLTLNESTLRNRLSRGIMKLKALLNNPKDMNKVLPSIAICGYLTLSNKITPPLFTPPSHSAKLSSIKSSKMISNKMLMTLTATCAVIATATIVNNWTNSEKKMINTPSKAPTTINNSSKLPPPQTFDFSKGDLNGFQVLHGSWDLQSGLRFSEGDRKTTISIPVDPTIPFSLRLEGYTFQKNREVISYGIYPGYHDEKETYFTPTSYFSSHTSTSVTKKTDGFYLSKITTTIVFLKDRLVILNPDIIRQIILPPPLPDNAKYCFISTFIATEKIHYTPLTPEKIEEFEKKTNQLLQSQKN